MKRRIIKLGQATYVTSLPSKWVRQFDLDKGDYLELEEKGNSIILSTQKNTPTSEITLDLKKINTRLISMLVQSVYILGYDKIILLHDPAIHEYKTAKKVKSTEFIQTLLNKRFIGAEIVEQTETKTVVMDLGGISEQTSEQVFNRIIFLTKALTQDCLQAIRDKNQEVLSSIPFKTDNIQRFLIYYQRIIAKTRREDALRHAVIAQMITQFKLMCGTYNHISKLALELNCSFSKKVLQLLQDVNVSLHQSLTICLAFNMNKAIEFIDGREKLWENLNSQKRSLEKNDLLLYGMFGELMFAMYSVVKYKFSVDQLAVAEKVA
ncbi:MAG: AbrB/MazE/SpoVT family DNA-binding domain-containing protein [Nanoarchaeota archaeon]|nr:AbrB/MazE/SpoVT family DNA-binding domain-containing protein [Nanoarchaeota archaeon]